jgi:N-acetyl-anhydromuramyl-L-alanine amidase AmpD
MARLVGEGIEKYTTDQIKIRQQIAGSGFGDSTRSVDFLQIQNNRNAWLKLGSSVRILTAKEMLDELRKQEEYKNLTLKEVEDSRTTGVDRLKDIDLDFKGRFMGKGLATEAVLFNSLSKVVSSTYDTDEKKTTNGSYISRSGVTNKASFWNTNNAYGLGGNNQGLVPPPGLIDAKVTALNRGSIRKATVNIKAHNKFQFELIELLYIRLGYTMLLEWGWDKYINSQSVAIEKMGNTLMEDVWFQDNEGTNFQDLIKKVEYYRKLYNGNYDGFIGRVSNFSWDFDTDGTYNITLNLITVGDVIESLKVNLPKFEVSKEQIKLDLERYNDNNLRDRKKENQKLSEESTIVTNAGNSTLAYSLFLDIINPGNTGVTKWKGGIESNYFNLFTGEETTLQTRTTYNTDSNGKKDTRPTTQNFLDRDKYSYFLTLGELLLKIQQLCIHSTNGNAVIDLDNDVESNIMSSYPNQISLDPRICFVKPTFSNNISSTEEPGKDKATYINVGYPSQKDLKKWFTVDESNTDCVYGKTMNIYVNYDFISTCLSKSTKKGEVFLYKFLQNLCDGINSALGDISNLEPIIEDDYKIVIQDQNKIRGIETSQYSDKFKEDDDVDFELFGYNIENSTSNILRKFNFETKITPQLSSMISIGATSNGTSTKNYDATSFSSWNSGLKDQYQLNLVDPKEISSDEILTNDDVLILSASFAEASIDTYVGIDGTTGLQIIPSLLSGFGGASVPIVRKPKESAFQSSTAKDITFKGTRNPDGNDLVTFSVNNYNFWSDYVQIAEKRKISKAAEIEKERLIDKKGTDRYNSFSADYVRYLIQGFGGKANTIPEDRHLYYDLNPDFINAGKKAFKAYVDKIDNEIYSRYGAPSTKIGFIPLDFSLESDGISGIKLYNRLNIRQKLLPRQYPRSVEFLIKNVNHTISDNDWSTELKTLSTPKTAAHSLEKFNFFDVVNDSIAKDSKLFLNPALAKSLTTSIDLLNSNSRTGLIYDTEETTKTQIVLHHTAGNNTAAGYIAGWQKESYPLATHYIIPRTGQTEQLYEDKYWSNHLGTDLPNNAFLQKHSLAVEISSYGYLTLKKNNQGKRVWQSWSGQEVPDNQVAEPYRISSNGTIESFVDKVPGGYRGYVRFQKYTDGQIKSLETILRGWKNSYPSIPLKLTPENYKEMFPNTKTNGEYDISKNASGQVPGLYTHNSYRPDKVDIFPQKELLEMLMGLDGESTTTTSSSTSTFTYYPQFAKVTEEVNGKEVKVTIEYDDGKNIGTAVGRATSRSTSRSNINIAKSSASLQAKGDLANQFNS